MHDMKKLLLILIISIPFGQKIDDIDIAMVELEGLLQQASRSSQKVVVEDFTGLQ